MSAAQLRGRRLGRAGWAAVAATVLTLVTLPAIAGTGQALAAPATRSGARLSLPHAIAPVTRHSGRSSASALGWASSNWSGYAATTSGSALTGVTGSWTVPTVTVGRRLSSSYSSTWVGIDGFNDNNLIQAGTEQDFYGGRAHYYAWWEILPAAETEITSLSVAPGDAVSVSISETGPAATPWVISVTVAGHHFTIDEAYSGAGSSAEWIEEAPSSCGVFQCHVLPLANYGKATFTGVTVNGGANPKLQSSEGGEMIQSGRVVSVPSAPSSSGDSDFSVAYGSTAPAPPA